MLVELGHYALILALLLAAAQAFFGLVGPALARERWLAAVPSAATGQFVFLSVAAGVLIHAFIENDFSVHYVAENSNSALPLFYRVTALWGAHEGSLLLWALVLGGWTVAVVARLRFLPPMFGARVLGVLGVVSFGFLLFTLCTSDPFARQIPAVPDGNDLNPVLQDFGALDSSADPLHRLRRLCGQLRVRVRRDDRRPARSAMGTLDAALDRDRVGLSRLGDRPRELVGVLRARLGRLLVLGSGRERLVHAVAGRHCADSFDRGHGQARVCSRAGRCCSRWLRSR